MQSCPGKAADIAAETLAAFLVAELIGVTRIGDVELADVANALGISYKACHQRRRRAESALVEWLTSDRYSPFEFVEKGPETPCSSNPNLLSVKRAAAHLPGSSRRRAR